VGELLGWALFRLHVICFNRKNIIILSLEFQKYSISLGQKQDGCEFIPDVISSLTMVWWRVAILRIL